MNRNLFLIKRFIILALIASLFFVYRRVGVRPNEMKKPPQYVFTYAENQSEDYPTSMGARYFADYIKEKSNGRMEVIIYYNSELGSESSVLSQMKYGGIDFTRVSLASLNKYNEKSVVLQMPYIYRDANHMWSVLDGELGEEILDSFDSGFKALSWYDAGVRNFYTVDRAIRSIDDLSGMKIRVQDSDINKDMLKLLGASAVPMDFSEVYSELMDGGIDGAENNYISYVSKKHFEIARYYTKDEHMRIPELQLISMNIWDTLNDIDKKIISDAARESALYERKIWNEKKLESERLMKENGVEIIELSDEEKAKFREAVKPLYKKYCKKYMNYINEIAIK